MDGKKFGPWSAIVAVVALGAVAWLIATGHDVASIMPVVVLALGAAGYSQLSAVRENTNGNMTQHHQTNQMAITALSRNAEIMAEQFRSVATIAAGHPLDVGQAAEAAPPATPATPTSTATT